MKKYLYTILALGLSFGCQPEFNDPINEVGFYTSGEADFSNYVAVGNSLTAGYADNALYIEGQLNSFPSMLADKFSLAGGGDFNQPLVADNLGGLLANGQQIQGNRLVLEMTASSQNPAPIEGTPTTDIANHLEGTFNNMGIPGAKSYHLMANTYGNIGNLPAANPYFIRIASSNEATVIGDAVAQDPTFFTLWIGNNDILGFATSGGIGEDQTGNLDPSTYGNSDITDPNVFANIYNELLKALTANGAKGAVANIPDVTAIPYFTTVPYNAIPLDEATAAMLNQAYAPYNTGLQQAAFLGAISPEEATERTINFTVGQNPVVLLDEDLTDLTSINEGLTNMRQATNQDLIPLPVSSVLGTLADPSDPNSVIGVGVPLNDDQLLTASEIQLVVTAQTAYNTAIKALADQYDIAFVDIQSLMNTLAQGGVSFDGGTITNTFGTGGAFSLDGVHPTQRGYAVVANNFIRAINSKYNSDLPLVNPGSYPTIFVK